MDRIKLFEKIHLWEHESAADYLKQSDEELFHFQIFPKARQWCDNYNRIQQSFYGAGCTVCVDCNVVATEAVVVADNNLIFGTMMLLYDGIPLFQSHSRNRR